LLIIATSIYEGCSAPVIAASESIPFKFDVIGLVAGSTTELKIEMTTILNRILFMLENIITGLKVLTIDENFDANRYPVKIGEKKDERAMTLYYTINVEEGESGREFKPIIIQQLRASYVDILYAV